MSVLARALSIVRALPLTRLRTGHTVPGPARYGPASMASIVQDWFGSAFSDLHPLLQQLHRHGGVLRGSIDVRFGNGLAGILGRRIAQRLGIAYEEANRLEVRIFSDDCGLHWNRRFNDRTEFRSTFVPIERFPHGHWRESSGPIQLLLQVAIVNGGWHWRSMRTYAFGIPLPSWLAPRTIAYKEIEGDGYRFRVDVGLPLFGTLFSYSGKLRAYDDSAPAIR